MSGAFTLERDGYGRLVLLTAEGERHVGVLPIRAFPLAAPDEGLAIVSAEGRELAWIDRLGELNAANAALVGDELTQREFMPTITQIKRVSTFSTPSTWEVVTDRGETSLVLKGEEDIRRVGGGALQIADSHGLRFRVSDIAALDKRSKRLLERFL
jgi:Domain of unknown function (DUF1854)